MKELAKEELKLLEAQHPSGYQYLKLQLKEFIHVLEEQEQEKEDQQAFIMKQQHEQFHMSCMTQESSNVKRKRKAEKENNDDDDDVHSKKRRGRERIKPTGAIQKAEACLRKIQALKKFFFGSSNH